MQEIQIKKCKGTTNFGAVSSLLPKNHRDLGGEHCFRSLATRNHESVTYLSAGNHCPSLEPQSLLDRNRNHPPPFDHTDRGRDRRGVHTDHAHPNHHTSLDVHGNHKPHVLGTRAPVVHTNWDHPPAQPDHHISSLFHHAGLGRALSQSHSPYHGTDRGRGQQLHGPSLYPSPDGGHHGHGLAHDHGLDPCPGLGPGHDPCLSPCLGPCPWFAHGLCGVYRLGHGPLIYHESVHETFHAPFLGPLPFHETFPYP